MNISAGSVVRRPGCWAVAALALGFGLPLWRLAGFAVRSDLYSYIVLVPLISLGLAWWRRSPAAPRSAPNRKLAAWFFAGGAAVLGGCAAMAYFGPDLAPPDSLVLPTLSFLLLFAGVCAWFLGRLTLRALAFPLAFLGFMMPLPTFATAAADAFLQHTSAAVAYGFFELAGLPVLRRSDLVFQLPDINLEVAPQCSGIHSSLALIITSLAAAYLFLRSPWKRAILALAAIPIGIIRNGFRIFVIGELCVRRGPQMINSSLHRTGGWFFFLLSLGPFFLLLFFLLRSERPFAVSPIKLAKA